MPWSCQRLACRAHDGRLDARAIGRAGLPAWSPQHWAILRFLVGRASPAARSQLDNVVQILAVRVSHMNDSSGVLQSAVEARRIIDAVTPQIAALSWRDDDVRAMM